MRDEPCQGITERGFARTVWTNHGDKLALRHLQADILQCWRIGERIFVCDVVQIYDSHIRNASEATTSRTSIQRMNLSEFVSGISCREVFACVDVKPRASMAMARSSTSTSEPKTSGPTSGTMAPTRFKKLLCVSRPRERCAEIIVCALDCICGMICSEEKIT